MNPNRRAFLAFFVFAALVVSTAIIAMSPQRDAGGCRAAKNYQVNIQNNQATPANVEAQVCDRLTITNHDSRERLIAFGPHDAHQAYDGITERLLRKGESFSVNLVQAGVFSFHDHYQEDVKVTFVVANE